MRVFCHSVRLGWLVAVAGWMLWTPASVAAQPAGATLRVIVTSADDGRILEGANVVLAAVQSDAQYAGATNPNGFLELSDVPPATYRLTVSFIGFETHEETLTLEPEERRLLEVALALQEQTLDEVRVEAERGAARREAGLQTVRAADLTRVPTPGPSGDLASYLQTLPGVVSAGDRGGQLYIRGGTPSQNLVLVDNMPVIKPFHISSLYSAFPEDIVRSVDFYAGGFSAKYMGGLSSVLDVNLRRGNMEQFAGSAAISPFIASARVEGPIERGRQSFLVVGRHSIIEETADPLLGRDVPLRFHDLTARYSVQGNGAACNLTGMHTYDRGRISTTENTSLTWSNAAVGGTCLLFGEGLNRAFELTGGLTYFENAAGTAGTPERSATLRRIHLGLEREQDLLGSTLDLGVRWTTTQYAANLDEKFSALQLVQQNGAALQAFAATAWTVGDVLTITPSLGTHITGRRIEKPTYEPRLRLSWRPTGTDQQEISLAVGKYNQVDQGITDERDAGTVFTVWKASEDDEALPQALHGILGYRQRLGRHLEVNVEGYVKDLSNIPVPQWTPEARFNTRTTLANGFTYGVDARLELTTRPFYAYVGYGWTTVDYEAARDDLGAWIEGDLFSYAPPHDRRHQVNAVASYEWAGFTANASWEFGTGRPYTKVYGFDLALDLPAQRPTSSAGTGFTFYDRPYGARLPVYHRLDVSVARDFTVSGGLTLETKAGAINTYDRSNIFYYDVNALQRINQSPLLPYLSLRVRVN
jgi:hypothetical protein